MRADQGGLKYDLPMPPPLPATPLLLAAALGAARCSGPGQERGTPPAATPPLAVDTASGSAPATASVAAPPPRTPAFPEVRLGIDEAALLRRFPGLEIHRYSDGKVQAQRRASVHGVAGTWTYTLEEGKLAWVMFDSYEKAITEANFDRYRLAIDTIEADYTKRYGVPIKRQQGKQFFEDPYAEGHHHWGYDVFDAVWKAEGAKIRARFHFMGGKGDYAFLVAIHVAPEDAPD
jgi:hypothetical protein